MILQQQRSPKQGSGVRSRLVSVNIYKPSLESRSRFKNHIIFILHFTDVFIAKLALVETFQDGPADP